MKKQQEGVGRRRALKKEMLGKAKKNDRPGRRKMAEFELKEKKKPFVRVHTNGFFIQVYFSGRVIVSFFSW